VKINLVGVGDGDGFAFWVVEPVHDLDVENHAEAEAEDRDEQNGDENSRPDGHREEGNAVVGVVETSLALLFPILRQRQRLDLQ